MTEVTNSMTDTIVMFMIYGFAVAIYLSCYPFTIYLRRYISLRKSQAVKLYLFGLFLICSVLLGVTMQHHILTRQSYGQIRSIRIFEGKSYESKEIGSLPYYESGHPKKPAVMAIGYLEMNGEYYKATIKDGKMTASGVDDKCLNKAMAGLKQKGKLKESFQGTSVSYDQLEEMDDAYYYPTKPATYIFDILFVYGPFLGTCIDIIIGRVKLRRKNRMLKMILDDL